MNKIISLLVLSFAVFNLSAQTNTVRKDYIEKYKATAVKKMLEHGIPASITLAQGILESGSGKSDLASIANNHFGIKCHKGWTGDSFIMDDDKKNECFRKYKTAAESFEDHSQFLMTRSRYAFLFEYKTTDYKKWAHGLKKAGYATNPRYAHLLIKVIEDNELHQYDKIKSMKELGIKEEKPKVVEPPKEQEPVATTTTDFKPVSVSDNQRLIYENEGVRYLKALKGDSFESIAAEFGIYTWQVRKYNDASKKTRLKSGDFVYIEKKNSKARIKFHIVQRGETLRGICQKYAVRMKKIKKLNGIKNENSLPEGGRLKLR